MQQKTTLPSIENFKVHAKLIKAFIRKEMKHGQILSLLAQQYAYKNWQTLKPALQKNISVSSDKEPDLILINHTIQVIEKTYSKFPLIPYTETMEKFTNEHPEIWETFLENSNLRKEFSNSDSSTKKKNIFEYTSKSFEEKFKNALSMKEGEEIFLAADLIDNHLKEETPLPLILVASSQKVIHVLKNAYRLDLEKFKNIHTEVLFTQGRSQNLKVFDIVNEKDFSTLPPRVLLNSEIIILKEGQRKKEVSFLSMARRLRKMNAPLGYQNMSTKETNKK